MLLVPGARVEVGAQSFDRRVHVVGGEAGED
jgi:hypothetical protein